MATTGCCDVKFKNPTNVKKLSEGNLEFALNLYQTMVEDQGKESNLFCSPFSVTAALCMTLAGAQGNTAAEIRKTLKVDNDDDDYYVHSALADIMESLNVVQTTTTTDDGDQQAAATTTTTNPFTLSCANRMYVHRSCEILEKFVATLVQQYRTEAPKSVDMDEATRRQINGWVEEVTANKIKDLIQAGMIGALTRMILVNAIYFKGNWSRSFDVQRTVDAEFRIPNSNSDRSTRVTVNMMNICANFPYAENADLKCKLLTLPYVGHRLSMLLLLPNDVDGLEALENRLCADPNTLKEVLNSTVDRHSVKVYVSIPRFKLESTFQLSDNVLRRMGIVDLFCSGTADLSGMTGDKSLHVSAVIHKAFVDVNEEGTEAAAATAFVVLKRCIEERVEFVADHPFVFLIYDKTTELILFAGRLVDPTIN